MSSVLICYSLEIGIKMFKKSHIISLLFVSASVFAAKLSDNDTFADGIGKHITFSSPESAGLSKKHYKAGGQSLSWGFKENDFIKINCSLGNITRTGGYGGTYSKATFFVWVYSEKIQKDASLTFNFNIGAKTTGHFSFPLDFRGWQRAALRYHWQPQFEGSISGKTDNITIVGKGAGSCFIDLICYNTIVDFRQQLKPGEEKWQSVKVDSKKYPLPKKLSDKQLKELHAVKSAMIKCQRPHKLAKLSYDEIKSKIKEFKIERLEDGTVRGIGISGGTRSGALPGTIKPNAICDLMARLAQLYHQPEFKDKKAEIVDLYLLLSDHLIDQGYRANGAYKWNWYNGRNFAYATFLMSDALIKAGKAKGPFEFFEYSYGTGDVFSPENINVNMDFLYFEMKSMLLGVLMQSSQEEAYRKMIAFKNYLDRVILFDGRNGFKKDGSAFHHNMHYFAYASYCVRSFLDIVYAVAGTEFAVSPEAFSRLKTVMLNKRFYINRTHIPFILEGRHPFQGQGLNIQGLKLLAKSRPDGKVDSELMAAYNRLAGLEGAESDPQGNLTMNYAGLQAHRYDDLLAVIKGYYKNVVHTETYMNHNRFGKFFAHGSLIVQNPKGPAGSGYVQNGINWAFIDGTTSVNQPLERLAARGSTVHLTSRIRSSGGLSHRGKFGIFNMIINGPGQQRVPMLRALKTYFSLGNEIICLGSDISNNDKFGDHTVTTLFQKHLKTEDMSFYVNNEKISSFPYSDTIENAADCRIVDPYHVGYYILNGKDLHIQSLTNHSRDQQNIKDTTGNKVIAWFDHGTKPEAQKYAYVLFMKSTHEELEQYKPDFKILRQDICAHAIEKDNYYGAVYFVPLKNITNDLVDAVSGPCMILTEALDDGGYAFTVNDPDLNLGKGKTKCSFVSQGTRSCLRLKGAWNLSDHNTKQMKVVARSADCTIIACRFYDGLALSGTISRGGEPLSDPRKYSRYFRGVDYSKDIKSASLIKKIKNKVFSENPLTLLLNSITFQNALTEESVVRVYPYKKYFHHALNKDVYSGSWLSYTAPHAYQECEVDLSKVKDFNTIYLTGIRVASCVISLSQDRKKWTKFGEMKYNEDMNLWYQYFRSKPRQKYMKLHIKTEKTPEYFPSKVNAIVFAKKV